MAPGDEEEGDSGDEDERGLDRLEAEAGDLDDLDEDEVRRVGIRVLMRPKNRENRIFCFKFLIFLQKLGFLVCMLDFLPENPV